MLTGALKAFLDGTAGVQFRPFEGDDARYAHIEVVLGRLTYAWLKRGDKGVVLRYLGRTTGLPREIPQPRSECYFQKMQTACA